jgi:hypothetical protein
MTVTNWVGHIMLMADERISKKDAGDEIEGKKTKKQAKNQVDVSSKDRYGKEREEMEAGETRQGMGRQGQMEISL